MVSNCLHIQLTSCIIEGRLTMHVSNVGTNHTNTTISASLQPPESRLGETRNHVARLPRNYQRCKEAHMWAKMTGCPLLCGGTALLTNFASTRSSSLRENCTSNLKWCAHVNTCNFNAPNNERNYLFHNCISGCDLFCSNKQQTLSSTATMANKDMNWSVD